MADRRLTQFVAPKPGMSSINQPPNNPNFRPPLPMQQGGHPDGRLSYQTSNNGFLRPPAHAFLHPRGARVNLQSQFSEPDDSSRSSIRSSISSIAPDDATPRSSFRGARKPLPNPALQHTQSRNKMLLSAIKQHIAASSSRGSINIAATGGSGAGGGMRERVKDERDFNKKDWQMQRMERLAESLREWGYGNVELCKLSQLPSKDFLKITYFLVKRLSPQFYDFILSQFGDNSLDAPEVVAMWRGYSSAKLVGKSHITAISSMSWKNCCAFLDWLHTEILLKETMANNLELFLFKPLMNTDDDAGQPIPGMTEEARRRKIQTRIGLDIACSQMEEFYRAWEKDQLDESSTQLQQIFDSDEFHSLCAEKAAEALGCNQITLAELQKQRDELKDYIVACKQRPTIDRLREDIVHLESVVSKTELDNQNAETRIRSQQQELAQLQADIEKRRQHTEEIEASVRSTEQLIANQSMSSGDAQDLYRQIEILQENRMSEEVEIDRLSDTLAGAHIDLVRQLQSNRDLVRTLESNLFEHGLLNFYKTPAGVDVMQPVMPVGTADVDAEFSRNYLANFSLGLQSWQEQLQRESDLNNEVAKCGDKLSAQIAAKKVELAHSQDVMANIQRDADAKHQTALVERKNLEAEIENDKAEAQKISVEIELAIGRQTSLAAQLRAKLQRFQELQRENTEAAAAIPEILSEFVRNTVEPCVAETMKAYAELQQCRREILEVAQQYQAKASEMSGMLEQVESSSGTDADK